MTVVLEFTRVDKPQDPYGFRFEAQDYTLRTTGGGRRSFRIAWDAALLADLLAIRQPACDRVAMKRVGDRLRDMLSPVGWDGLGEQIRHDSETGRRVLLTIRSNAAELYTLPWELLTVGESQQHVGALPGVLVRHEWPETTTTAEATTPRAEGGRILLAWSAAGGAVPAAEHQQELATACTDGHAVFAVDRDVLAHTSLASLERTLAQAKASREPFVALHLLCHGGRQSSTFGGSDGGASVVDGGQIAQILLNYAGTLRLVVLAACNGGDNGDPGNHLGSVAQALHRAGIQSVMASRYQLSDTGSTTLTRAFYRALLVDLAALEDAFMQARTRLASEERLLDWASMQLYARAADGEDTRPVVVRPYRGLLAFHAQHCRFFFGRAAEIDRLLVALEALARASEPRLVVVAGASGTGKSSMVLAGAVPRLLAARDQRWESVDLRPGRDPLGALATALARGVDGERPLLLVVDQFEELFTQTVDPEARQDFVRRLWALASDASAKISVVLTMRIDFIGRTGEIVIADGRRLDRVIYGSDHLMLVAQLEREQLSSVIAGPAERVGLELDPGLLDDLVDDAGVEPGALPLLEDTLDALWQRRNGRCLTQTAYLQLGKVTGALSHRADALIKGLDSADRTLARALLVRLVGLRGDADLDTRRRVPIEDLTPNQAELQPRFEPVLAKLVDERLLVRGREGERTTIEIAHEALIRGWDTLRTWIREDREKLLRLEQIAAWVVEWKARKVLLTGGQLSFAEDTERRWASELNADARDLLASSRAHALRQRNRRRAALGGLFAAAIGFAALAWWGLAQADKAANQSKLVAEKAEQVSAQTEIATQQAKAAKQQALEARDAARLAAARQAADDSTTAAALLREVESRDPGEIYGWVDLVREVHAAPFLTEHVLSGSDAAWSPDGTLLVTAVGPEAWVWRADGTRAATITSTERKDQIMSATWHPDGTRIATISRDGPVEIWRTDGSLVASLEKTDRAEFIAWSPDGANLITIMSVEGRIWRADGALLATPTEVMYNYATWSPDSRWFVTNDIMGEARVCRADGTTVARLVGTEKSGWHDEDVLSAAWDHTSERIVTASKDGTAIVWKRDGSHLATLGGHLDEVNTAVWSPNGEYVVTTSDDYTARVWKASGALVASLAGHQMEVRFAAWSPDGTRIVTGSLDRSARIWELEPGEPSKVSLIASLDGHYSEVSSAAWNRSGTRIVTSGFFGGVRIWRANQELPDVTLKGHQAKLIEATWNHDGSRVLTVAESGAPRIWSADGTPLVVFKDHEYGFESAGWSPEGTRVVITAEASAKAQVWTADGEHLLATLDGGAPGSVARAVWSPDGKRIVTVARDRTTRLWTADGVQKATLAVLDGSDRSGRLVPVDNTPVKWSPDGSHIVAAQDTSAAVWKADGTFVSSLTDSENPIYTVEWSPDSTRVVTVAKDIRISKVDGARVATFGNPEDTVRDLAWSPDGAHIVSIYWVRNWAQVWRADGTAGARLEGSRGWVTSAEWSSDGARIVTASMDGTARIWKPDGTLIATLTGHGGLIDGEYEQGVQSAAWSPDTTRIVTAGDDRAAQVSVVGPRVLQRWLWTAVTVCISVVERQSFLGESVAEAEFGLAQCQAMQRCLRAQAGEVSAETFERCDAEFRQARDVRHEQY